MPRHPDLSGPAGAMPASIFSRLVERLARYQGETFPFHIGDTHLDPPLQARLEKLTWDQASAGRLYNYAAPAGDARLLDAIVGKLREKNGITATPANLQVTAGATHGFACAARALLDAGDEVLLLAPYWPLFRGHVVSVGARAVEVPFSSTLIRKRDADPRALLENFVTPKTAAIYLITPNNPDGFVLGERELEAIADVARRHDLWVLADEVYEEFTFDGRRHRSIAVLPGMAERTVTVFSFSKSYAQAGLRVGYTVAPEGLTVALRKLANHSIYNVPRAMQRAALTALEQGEPFLAQAREEYKIARDLAVLKLGPIVDCPTPEGGSYVFVDLGKWLKPGETAVDLLEKLAGEVVLLAPGAAFGKEYAGWARLCYTAVPMVRLEAGLDKMLAVLGRG